MSIIQYCALVSIALFAVVTWVFVVRYARNGVWKTYREGRTLMFMKVCLGIVTTIFFLFRFVFSSPDLIDVRSAIYTVLFLVMTWQMIQFNRYLFNSHTKASKNVMEDENNE